MPWQNHNKGTQYAVTYNEVSTENIALMLKNHLLRVGEKFIRINKELDVFTLDTEKYYYPGDYIDKAGAALY